MRTRSLASFLAAGLCFVACGSERREPLEAAGGPGVDPSSGFGVEAGADDGGAGVCQKMDILFVIDDSGSMKEEQSGLAASFPSFISVLDKFEVAGGGLLDYRVAVTTTGRDVSYTIRIPATGPFPETNLPMNEKGMNGELRQACGMSRRWIERSDSDVSGTFACLAQVGTKGPGVEMPLLGAELAFNDRLKDGTNAGFLRDDALLAIVFITDEEDCSRRDDNFVELNDMCEVTSPNVLAPTHFIDFFDGLKQGRGRWAAAAIAGPAPCESAFGSAIEASRLKQFVGLTGQNGVFSSICAGNLAGALEAALKTFTAACASFPGPK